MLLLTRIHCMFAGIPGIPPCDGGLPCLTAFCPVDISGEKTTVANEFCEVDALEDDERVRGGGSGGSGTSGDAAPSRAGGH